MSDETGELTETRGEAKVEWRIENPAKSNMYRSPVIPLYDSCWCLVIIFDLKGKMYLYLKRRDFGPPKTLSYAIGFKKADGEEDIVCQKEKFLITEDFENDMPLAEDTETIQFSPGVVIITFSMRSEEKHCARVSLFRRLWNTSITLKQILKKRENTDVVLKVMNEESAAHRLILDSMCPGFLNKVEREMKEGQTGETGAENYGEGTLPNVLAYIYSGVLDELSLQNVRSVYKFAHNYQLKELLKLCAVFIEKSITTTDVCYVIKFADSYNDTILKEHAKEFFAKNSPEILVTCEWKDFKEKNSDLCIEILEHMMSKKVV